MTIRAARASDAPVIARLWNHVIADTLVTFSSDLKSEAQVLEVMDACHAAGHGYFVAERNGVVQGFASYGQFRAGTGYARTMEHSIALDPAAQGQGLGRAMMAVLEAHATAGGAQSIFAGVSAANPAGRGFHAALGYREAAVLRAVGHKWGRTLDLILMQKILSPIDTGG